MGHSPPGAAGDSSLSNEPALGVAAGSNLTRMTVNLIRPAVQALDTLTDETGLSKTDVVNRALQIYKIVNHMMQEHDGVLTILHPDGTVERVHIL
jgi:hypothetical protein